MQQQEEALRGLIHALKVCLNQSADRAKQIVAFRYEDYLAVSQPWEFDEPDAAQKAGEWAEFAFLDELGRAQDALTWRAVVVAYLTGRAIWDYAAIQGDELVDPWIDWRGTLADQAGAQFVRGLAEDDLLCLGLAYHVDRILRFDQPPERVPTDGDINAIAGFLETMDAPTWPQWFEILGEPPKEIRCRYLLQLARAAAERDLGGGGSVQGSSDLGRRVSDLTDQVESVAASQLPIIDHLERITAHLARLGPLNKFQAEESLKKLLGDRVYSSLCGDARIALLDAEIRYQNQDTVDWNSVVANLGKAFELQLKHCFLPTLAQYLKQRSILCFPQGETLSTEARVQPIIKNGGVIPVLTLGLIATAFKSESAPLRDFCRDHGVNLGVLKEWVFKVKEPRNTGAHEARMSSADACALREKWLGERTRDGGAFGALCLR